MKDDNKYVKVEATGFQDLCNRIRELEDENQQLKVDNDFLQHENQRQRRMINGLKLNNSRLTLERNELNNKLQNLTIFDLSEKAQAEAGHLLARSLLGKPMTDEEVKIAETESRYDYYTGDDF